MVLAVDVFNKVELVNRNRVWAVGQAQQHVRQRQGHVAGVFRITEGAPLDEFCGLKALGQVARNAHLRKAVPIKKLGAGSGDKRCVSGSGHVGNLLQHGDVLRMAAKFIVADQHAVGIAAKGAVFLLVNLLEERALIKLRRLFQVGQQLLLGDVEQTQLEHGSRLGVGDEIKQTAPCCFQRLKLWRVHDGVELVAQLLIDFRNALLDAGDDGVFAHRHAFIEHLYGVLREQIDGIGALRIIARNLALLNDAVQQRHGSAGLGRARVWSFVRHWACLLPSRWRPSTVSGCRGWPRPLATCRPACRCRPAWPTGHSASGATRRVCAAHRPDAQC